MRRFLLYPASSTFRRKCTWRRKAILFHALGAPRNILSSYARTSEGSSSQCPTKAFAAIGSGLKMSSPELNQARNLFALAGAVEFEGETYVSSSDQRSFPTCTECPFQGSRDQCGAFRWHVMMVIGCSSSPCAPHAPWKKFRRPLHKVLRTDYTTCNGVFDALQTPRPIQP